jgi:hypothetical protein
MTGLPRLGGLPSTNADTRFHIDYGWWESQQAELRNYLLTHISDLTLRDRLKQSSTERVHDFVDPETGEVSRLNALEVAIKQQASRDGFINQRISLVDNVFRVFLANGNTPLSPRELEPIVGKPASLIHKTIGGTTIYKGIHAVDE